MIKTFMLIVRKKTAPFEEEDIPAQFLVKGEHDLGRALLTIESRGLELLDLQYLGECGDNKELAQYLLDHNSDLET